MGILDAKIMPPDEVEKIRLNREYKNKIKRDKSTSYCEQNKDAIIKNHSDYYSIRINNEYTEYLKNIEYSLNYMPKGNRILQDIRTGHPHYCQCGALMKEVNGRNGVFVGCSKWNKTNDHNSYNVYEFTPQVAIEFPQFQDEYEFNRNYLSEFMKHFKMKDVMPSILFNYLQEWNQHIYCESITADSFTVGVDNQKLSKIQEQEILKILTDRWTKVQYQLNLQYTCDGITWGHKIPDFIVSDESIVIIIEAKSTISGCNMDTLSLYHDIMECLMAKLDDKRELYHYHVGFTEIYDEIPLKMKQDYRYLTLDELKSI